MEVDRRELRTLDAANSDEITFLCLERDWRVIPEPKPVGEYLDADERNREYGLPSSLAHRKLVESPPDSAVLSAGWILSVPGEFQIGVDESGVASVESSFEDGDYIGTFRTGAASTKFGRCANVKPTGQSTFPTDTASSISRRRSSIRRESSPSFLGSTIPT